MTNTWMCLSTFGVSNVHRLNSFAHVCVHEIYSLSSFCAKKWMHLFPVYVLFSCAATAYLFNWFSCVMCDVCCSLHCCLISVKTIAITYRPRSVCQTLFKWFSFKKFKRVKNGMVLLSGDPFTLSFMVPPVMVFIISFLLLCVKGKESSTVNDTRTTKEKIDILLICIFYTFVSLKAHLMAFVLLG